jgi:hypothetical protein
MTRSHFFQDFLSHPESPVFRVTDLIAIWVEKPQ